jgi:competence protein ComEA
VLLFVFAFLVSLCSYASGAPLQTALAGTPAPQAAYRLDLNGADAARIELLPGMGPVTARAIVEYRREHGPFSAVSGLEEVPGIGPKRIEMVRPFVTLGPGN